MGFACHLCGYEAKSKAGLFGHVRLAHDRPTAVDNRKLELQEALDGVSVVLDRMLGEVLSSVLDEKLKEQSDRVVEKITMAIAGKFETPKETSLESGAGIEPIDPDRFCLKCGVEYVEVESDWWWDFDKERKCPKCGAKPPKKLDESR